MCQPGFFSVDHVFDSFNIVHMQSQMGEKNIDPNQEFTPDFV